jgi:hypothetical protein
VKADAGDRIVVETERLTRGVRTGVIEEVLQEAPPRFRVRWDDGHISTMTPAAGAATIEKQKQKRKATSKR